VSRTRPATRTAAHARTAELSSKWWEQAHSPQALVEADQFVLVRAQRQAFEDEIGPLFRQIVEELTGRKVRLPQVTEEGVAVEVFVLVPDSERST